MNPKRNWCSVKETARLKLSGLPSTGKEDFSTENGNSGTPLIGAGSMAMAAAARLRPSRFWTSSPPKEWPMRMGFLSNAFSCPATWSAISVTPKPATAPAFLRVASVVSESPGQLAATAW